MITRAQKASIEKGRNIGRFYGAVGITGAINVNFNKALKPQHAARAIANDLNVCTTLLCLSSNSFCDTLCANS